MIFIIFISVIGIVLFFIFAESRRECKQFKVTSYFIPVESKDMDNLKIVMMADLHSGYFSRNSENLLKTVTGLAPDMIIIAGDMITCRRKEKKNNITTAGFINKLCDIAPVFYGMGNHERGVKNLPEKMGDNWEEYTRLLNHEVKMLSNRYVTINRENSRISIYGLDISGKYFKRLYKKKLFKEDVDKLLGEPDEGYNILIAHNPDYFYQYEEWGANLVLSGHNHGGMIQLGRLGGLISPRLRIFPKYYHGLYKRNGTDMILTNGLGAHSIKIRVNNIPEIVFIKFGINGTDKG